MKGGRSGFGAELGGDFGRLLMRGAYNSDLYGPLQTLYEQGRDAGTDVWIHKNRCVCCAMPVRAGFASTRAQGAWVADRGFFCLPVTACAG